MNYRGHLFTRLQRYRAAINAYTKSAELLAQVGDIEAQAITLANRIRAHVAGKIDIHAEITAAFAHNRMLPIGYAKAFNLLTLGELAQQAGHVELAYNALARTRTLAENSCA